jgi:hypothetical protein
LLALIKNPSPVIQEAYLEIKVWTELEFFLFSILCRQAVRSYLHTYKVHTAGLPDGLFSYPKKSNFGKFRRVFQWNILWQIVIFCNFDVFYVHLVYFSNFGT